MSRGAAVVTLAAISLVFFGVGAREAARDSATFDEPVSLSAGVTYLTRHDLRVNIEHPPLAKAISALPVLLAHPVIPDGDTWDDAPKSTFAFDFDRANADDLDRLLFLSRLPSLVMAIAVGWVVYAMGVRVASRRAAVITAALWLTTPVVVGYGHIFGLDVPFTLAVAVTSWLGLRYFERPTTGRAAAVGAAVGAALLVRTAGLVLLPVMAVAIALAAGVRPSRGSLGRAALMLVVAWAVLWGGYRAIAPGGSTRVHSLADYPFVCPSACPESVVDRTLAIVPTPEEFRVGTRVQGALGTVSRDGFVLGQHVKGVVPWFWPASLAIKLSLAALVAFVAGIVGWFLDPAHRRQLGLFVALPAAALGIATVIQAAPVGVRYLLPVLALALVGAAVVAERLLREHYRTAVAILGVIVLVQAVSFVDGANDSLAWTNWPFRPAYRWAADSNVDWGQDIDGLHDWAATHPAWLAIDSPLLFTDPVANARPLRGAEQADVDGWLAVGASTLDVYARDQLAWLRAYCPVGHIGGSILLYRLERAPDRRPGPEQPVPPCENEEFGRREG